MLGLPIKDKIRWHDPWSVEFGRRFQIHAFTDNLIISLRPAATVMVNPLPGRVRPETSLEKG